MRGGGVRQTLTNSLHPPLTFPTIFPGCTLCSLSGSRFFPCGRTWLFAWNFSRLYMRQWLASAVNKGDRPPCYQQLATVALACNAFVYRPRLKQQGQEFWGEVTQRTHAVPLPYRECMNTRSWKRRW